MRYVGAVIGFCVIAAVYGAATVFTLGSLVMAHCVQSDAEIEAGGTCTPPADLFFWPLTVVALIGLVLVQWRFLRWALRKRG